ncbi:RNA polymerase-binding transcription factor DksA [Microbacterium oxydans]|jgi:DnaK suppressor protein|uniref:RNA polymerase-binding transcription factor DksA n=1 Tax=Microbacterium oxydans TaxID=82380 RepID=A0A0F0KSM4_9MICO|nr:TraR/DksA family transcriptional regulator [Microbacterium oxydans]KJL23484.1 RNA polymerase-binding transcription factor DksA [Microbacterium oxydans]
MTNVPLSAAAVETPQSLDVRAQLEQRLQERQTLLVELEPHAIPTIDLVAYQTAAAHRVAIRQISAALDRLDAGTYGQCVRCGRQIAPARLEVVPHAFACIECQNHAEAA